MTKPRSTGSRRRSSAEHAQTYGHASWRPSRRVRDPARHRHGRRRAARRPTVRAPTRRRAGRRAAARPISAKHGVMRHAGVWRAPRSTPRPRPGPLIVEEYEGTTVVPPMASAARDDARQHRHRRCAGESNDSHGAHDIDPILLEVFRRTRFDTIADEMALILMRTAHSPIVRDSMDFSTAHLRCRQGQTLGAGPDHADASRQLLRCDAPSDRRSTGRHLATAMCSSSTIRIWRAASICPTSTSSSRSSTRSGWRLGHDDRASCRCRRHRARQQLARRDRDLSGGPAPAVPEARRSAASPTTPIWEHHRAPTSALPDKVLGDLQAQLAACTAGERELSRAVRALRCARP